MGGMKYFEVILEGAAEGKSNRQIAARLNKLGIGTPKQGKPWTPKQVSKHRSILLKKNPESFEYLLPEYPMPEFPRERNMHVWLVGTPFLDHDVTGHLHTA